MERTVNRQPRRSTKGNNTMHHKTQKVTGKVTSTPEERSNLYVHESPEEIFHLQKKDHIDRGSPG